MFSHPRTLQPVQRVNHLPGNKHLYRKDTLASNLTAIAAELPEAFGARAAPPPDAAENRCLSDRAAVWLG